MDTPLPPMNPEVAHVRRRAYDRKYRKHLRFARLLWGVVVLLLLTVAIEAGVALCFSPRNWVYRIEVTGTETLTPDEVIRLMALPPRSNFFRAPLGTLAARIAAEPRVQEARVRRGQVGVLIAELRERQAVCRLGYTRPPVYLDAQGVPFTRPTAPDPPVPTVEGLALNYTRLKLGTPLRMKAADHVRECLAALNATSLGKSRVHLSRVQLTPDGNYTLVLQPGTKVFLGKPKNFRLKTFILLQGIVQASTDGHALSQIAYFDLRYVVDATGKGAAMRPKTPGGAEHP
jgi:cell division septal protein FtsQ